MSTGGKKVVSILDIPLPELDLNSKKLIFVELELALVKIKLEKSNLNPDLLK